MNFLEKYNKLMLEKKALQKQVNQYNAEIDKKLDEEIEKNFSSEDFNREVFTTQFLAFNPKSSFEKVWNNHKPQWFKNINKRISSINIDKEWELIQLKKSKAPRSVREYITILKS